MTKRNEDQDSRGGEPVLCNIDERRRIVWPQVAIDVLSWNADTSEGARATFELLERGKARLLPYGEYAAAFERAGSNHAMVDALKALLFPAVFAKARRMTIPAEVAFHVLETVSLTGPCFVVAQSSELQIFGVGRRAREVRNARGVAADILPP